MGLLGTIGAAVASAAKAISASSKSSSSSKSSGSSSSSSKSSGSSSVSTGRTLQVGADGKAPSNAQIGDKIQTNGGTYLITGGTPGNWTSVKVDGTSGSSSSSSSGSVSGGSSSSSSSGSSSKYTSSYLGKTYTGGGNVVDVSSTGTGTGELPAGYPVGTIVKTNGGYFQVTGGDSVGTSTSGSVSGGSSSGYTSSYLGKTYTGNGNVVDVSSTGTGTGKLPSGYPVGTIVKTNNGYYEVTGGTSVGTSTNTVAVEETLKNYGVTSTGRKFQVNSNGKAPKGLTPGDVVVTAGGSYIIVAVNEDGTYQSLKYSDETSGTYDGVYNSVSSATDVNNNKLSIIRDADNNILGVYNADGTQSTTTGLIQDMQSSEQYIATVDSDGIIKYIVAVPNAISIVDAKDPSLHEIELDGTEGSLSSDNLVFGENNRIYLKDTGQLLAEVASEYGIDVSNVAFGVRGNDGNTRYFSINGTDVTDQLGAAAIEEWTENDIYNALVNAMKEVGWIDYPEIADYDALTWEQAMARAAEQLSPAYESSLDSTLDAMNQKALETGFYGQLPTEALRQQAAADSELSKQQAITELARNLMSDSQDYAQQLYQDDVNTTSQRMSSIQKILNFLYQENQDKIQQAQTQQELDQIMEQLVADAIIEEAKIEASSETGYQSEALKQWISNHQK